MNKDAEIRASLNLKDRLAARYEAEIKQLQADIEKRREVIRPVIKKRLEDVIKPQ